MNKIQTYTSTGIKLLHHPHAVDRFKHGLGTPISLQIAPTSVCNLKCKFCSNVNRQKQETLPASRIHLLIKKLDSYGLKTVEWTGGGDPTMYPPINKMIEFSHSIGLEQGFITNGVALKDNVSARALSYLKWIRISMNSLDYVNYVELPEIPESCTLGFSYVYNSETTDDVLGRLGTHVIRYRPKYVRVVPNCQCTTEQQKENNVKLSKLVKKWGPPYFYQPKEFEKPENCYWCYFKPFVLHDGYVYPCSSVVLNSDSGRYFHKKYRWVKMEDLPSVYAKKVKSFDPSNCDHCVFTVQNDTLTWLSQTGGMENFV